MLLFCYRNIKSLSWKCQTIWICIIARSRLTSHSRPHGIYTRDAIFVIPFGYQRLTSLCIPVNHILRSGTGEDFNFVPGRFTFGVNTGQHLPRVFQIIFNILWSFIKADWPCIHLEEGGVCRYMRITTVRFRSGIRSKCEGFGWNSLEFLTLTMGCMISPFLSTSHLHGEILWSQKF